MEKSHEELKAKKKKRKLQDREDGEPQPKVEKKPMTSKPGGAESKVKTDKKKKKKSKEKKAKAKKLKRRERSSSSSSSSDGEGEVALREKASVDSELRALLALTGVSSGGTKKQKSIQQKAASPSPESPNSILKNRQPAKAQEVAAGKDNGPKKKKAKKADAIPAPPPAPKLPTPQPPMAAKPPTPKPLHMRMGTSVVGPGAKKTKKTAVMQPPVGGGAKGLMGGGGAKGSIGGNGGGAIKAVPTTAEELARRHARARRFADRGGDRPSSSSTADDVVAPRGGLVNFEKVEGDYWDAPAIQGTCQRVEKDFIRQLERVDPCSVRPVVVLQRALERVKHRWRHDEDYDHAWNQVDDSLNNDELKSIRQDLMVQHIETPFTVHVYETHARMALEAGDLNEFTLCCARLSDLRGRRGLETSVAEFTAYRLLHALYKKHFHQIYLELLRCDASVRGSEAVVHAFAVIKAEARQDPHAFFRLYEAAPHMSAYLMDFLLLRMRRLAASSFFKACRPSLPLSLLTRRLAFGGDEGECREFLQSMGAVVSDEGVVDCKASFLAWAAKSQA